MEILNANSNFEIHVDVFKGDGSNDIYIISSYYKRKLKERVFSMTNTSSVKLNYIENKYLKNNADIIQLQHSYLEEKSERLLFIPKKQRPKVVIILRGSGTYMKPWLDKNWLQIYKY